MANGKKPTEISIFISVLHSQRGPAKTKNSFAEHHYAACTHHECEGYKGSDATIARSTSSNRSSKEGRNCCDWQPRALGCLSLPYMRLRPWRDVVCLISPSSHIEAALCSARMCHPARSSCSLPFWLSNVTVAVRAINALLIRRVWWHLRSCSLGDAALFLHGTSSICCRCAASPAQQPQQASSAGSQHIPP